MTLAEDIKKFFRGEVSEDQAIRDQYRHDASIFDVNPSLIVAPRDSEDIKSLVKFVSHEKAGDSSLSITARSAGTDMSGGPLSEGIVMDMTKHFNQIHDIGADFAVVDPGVYYRDLDKETRRRDLFMPSYPASREICTVGGMVANNSGGEKTLAYGKTEQYVQELSVVLSDGNEYDIRPLSKQDLDAKMKLPTFEGKLYKQLFELIEKNKDVIEKARPNVTKNSAGYYLWNIWNGEVFDLPKLIVGSQGTLGIVTQIKFKLVKVKPYSKMAVLFLRDLSHLGEVVVDLVALKPESIESYDDRTLRLAIHFFRDLIKVIKPKNMFKMFVGFLPEFMQILKGGLPKLVVLVEFTGATEAEIDPKIARVYGVARKFGITMHLTKTADEANEYWAVRRESFNLLRHRVKDRKTAPFIDDFSVRPEVLPEFLPKLNAILGKYKLIYTINGHPGDGNFHIIPLMKLNDPTERAIIGRLSDEVYDLVIQYKGSITAEHNDGIIRTPYLEKMYGAEVVALFEQVKKIFDPQNIFNPGKKVGGTTAYALSHIRRD